MARYTMGKRLAVLVRRWRRQPCSHDGIANGLRFTSRLTIIDLRDNGGWDPKMVAHISSYLFSKRTHLNDIWERPRNRTEQFHTNPDVGETTGGGPHPGHRMA